MGRIGPTRIKIAADVPKFLEIVRGGALGDFGAKGGVAARTRQQWIMVAALFSLG